MMRGKISLAIALALLVAAVSMSRATLLDTGIGPATNGVVVLTPCTSTGIYDLSNTCNDIYFLGALK